MKEFVTKKLVYGKETDDYCHSGAGHEYVSEEAYEDFNWEVIKVGFKYGQADAGSVPISYLEDAIVAIKAAGGTHISVDYHCDHGSYIIEGFEIRMSTEEEIESHLGFEEAELRKNLLKEQALLEARLESIKVKLNSK